MLTTLRCRSPDFLFPRVYATARPTQNPLVSESVYLQNLLNIVETDSSGAVVLDFRAVDFLNFTLRLRLSRSVENLLLTSSLALLDSTLPKIRQNDGKGIVILRL